MAEQVEGLAAKTDDLSSIPRTCVEEGEHRLLQVVITSTCMLWHLHTPTQNKTKNLKRK